MSEVTTLLAELRSIRDEREELNRILSSLSSRESEIEHELLAFHETTGLENVSGGGLSVTFDTKAMRAKYDPERWPDIVRWAVSTGHDYIVQRRLSDGKIVDLVSNGVALPEGLTLENYVRLSVRRK